MSYPIFKTPEAAAEKFKLCRLPQWWILEDNNNCELNCSHCKNKIKDLPPDEPELPPGYISNRCVFNPRTKTHKIYHYVCAWKSVL